MFVSYGCSDSCINRYEICVNCGCCERQENYIHRSQNMLELYKEERERNKNFDRFSSDQETEKLQRKNIAINDKYFAKQIRYIKTELNRLMR